ncbi:aldo/keto reductase [Hydrogenophaga sp.]|uniref:aldo/keto reductase n=1 Tax=Hydrogenophaga sp. TaxID=1904254 RepID=UPI0025C1DECB|nr:aldo/keto reductase [Hydrogenophaga sp.]MBT9463773.1 aldo/keto reductase [Hydrogenophaga sp.]
MKMDRHTDLISQRLGFGCGRLKGGHEKANALRLVHAALDLGLRHFDTAPPYGLGTSESVLGEALKGRQEPVTVFTKAGLARPASPGLMQTARAIVKPLANHIPGLRKAVLKGMAHRAAPANFNPDFIAQSFETSLRLLQREQVDGLLLHEAQAHDTLAPLKPLFDRYVAQGQLVAYGSSTGEPFDQLVRFGTVLQYRCPVPGTDEVPSEFSDEVPPASTDILHGAFRFIAPAISEQMARDSQLKDQLASLLPAGTDPAAATGALALAYALAQCHNRLLFSTNQPQRLATTLQHVRHVTGSAQWRPAMQTLHAAFAQTGALCAA